MSSSPNSMSQSNGRPVAKVPWGVALLICLIVFLFLRQSMHLSRRYPSYNSCINNLRQMDGAAQEWVLEYTQQAGATVHISDITPYIKLTADGKLPTCPQGGTYTTSWIVSNHPTCSLSTAKQPHILP
jgi:hypothetical protein